MSSDDLDEVAFNIDDAKTVADELQDGLESGAVKTSDELDKIDELKDALTRASDIIDEITDTKDTE